jgi:phospholipid/cholesterol/gamma-HCH transport system substrate-binding protein
MRRLLIVLGCAMAAAVTLSGCASLQSVPLPSVISGPTYPVTVEFHSALGLPVQASVKRDGAIIGEVTTITTKDYLARVEMAITTDVELPAGERAQIRFSSPMGEAFIELSDPTSAEGTPISTPLESGDTIPVAATEDSASVTDLLASVSTLITGGAFADMKVIVDQLNIALTGRSDTVHQLLARFDSTLATMNAHTDEFDTALNRLTIVSRQLARDNALLASSLTTMTPAIHTLTEQRQELLTLATQLRKLSTVGTRTIVQSRTAMLSVIKDLAPILDTLTNNEGTFKPIFDGIHDFASQTDSAIRGVYLNFDLTMVVNEQVFLSADPVETLASLLGLPGDLLTEPGR